MGDEKGGAVLSQEPGTIDPGNYRTTPLPAFGTAKEKGSMIEAQRMAEFVVSPVDVDPDMSVKTPGPPLHVLKNGDAASLILSVGAAKAAVANGMICGVSVTRGNEDGTKDLVQAVLRFPTPETATKAADEMSAANTQPNPDFPEAPTEQPSKIDILPNSRVTTMTQDGRFSSNSFTPHGSFVLYTWAEAPETEKDWAAKVTAEALKQQSELIDKFPPTPADKLADVPVDVDGVLRLTVPKTASGFAVEFAVYGPTGVAHFASDVKAERDIYKKTGMTNMAIEATQVYKTRDKDAANELAEFNAKDIEAAGNKKIVGPPGVADAACWESTATRVKIHYTCIIVVDRYFALMSSEDKTDTYQLTSAQHQMLANRDK